jgi:hypothetical protein
MEYKWYDEMGMPLSKGQVEFGITKVCEAYRQDCNLHRLRSHGLLRSASLNWVTSL